MLGPIIIVIVLLVFPVTIFMSGAVAAGILGHFLKKDVDALYEGSEFLELG